MILPTETYLNQGGLLNIDSDSDSIKSLCNDLGVCLTKDRKSKISKSSTFNSEHEKTLIINDISIISLESQVLLNEHKIF